MTEGWNLGSLVALQRGTTYRSALIGEPGPVLLGLGTIARNGGFRGDSLKTYGGSSKPGELLGAGDLYVSLKDITQSADLLGAVARVPQSIDVGRLTQDTVGLALRCNSVRSDYLYWILRTPQYRAWCRSHATGTTNLGLSREDFFAFQVPAPNPARERLVDLMGALDEKIASNIALLFILDEYLSVCFACLVSNCLNFVFLRDLADVNPQVAKPASGQQLRYIDIASVGVGEFDFPELSSWDNAPGRARRGLRHGDTLWSTVRPNRRSHALNLSADPRLVASTGLAVLRPRTVGFAYLYELTRRTEFTTYLESVAEGSAYPAVRTERFRDATVPLVEGAAREAFESAAAPLREFGARKAVESRILEEVRDALLPQLMSGKIRVKDAERVVGEVA